MDKSTKIVLDIFYIILVVSLITYLWWGPYQKRRMFLQKEINNAISLRAVGLNDVLVSKKTFERQIIITNNSKKVSDYTICLTTHNNVNNYILYKIIDGDDISDVRSLSLDGGIFTGSINPGEERSYTIILWSMLDDDILGKFSLIPHSFI